LTLDPGFGEEKFGSGIRDKHPGSATLKTILNKKEKEDKFLVFFEEKGCCRPLKVRSDAILDQDLERLFRTSPKYSGSGLTFLGTIPLV
jgi:hypothetical protein